MPLRQTIHGGECPIGQFTPIISGGAGGYTKDPVEVCTFCNFADSKQKVFDLEAICLCPPDLTCSEYNKLKEEYRSKEKVLSKEGFLKFVNEHYKGKSQ